MTRCRERFLRAWGSSHATNAEGTTPEAGLRARHGQPSTQGECAPRADQRAACQNANPAEARRP
jgi:hypothetical protein